jgi:hypothetical protein
MPSSSSSSRDPRTLLSEEAAELLATRPPRVPRAFILIISLLVIGVAAWVVLAPIESVVFTQGSLTVWSSVEARVPASDAKRLRRGQVVRVSLRGTHETRSGSLQRIEGPLADPERGLVLVATVSLDDGALDVQGERRPLPAGLPVSLEIVTGETTPLAWLVGHAWR